jgi:hypothetical protein
MSPRRPVVWGRSSGLIVWHAASGTSSVNASALLLNHVIGKLLLCSCADHLVLDPVKHQKQDFKDRD